MTHFDGKRRQFLQLAAFGTMAAAWPGFILAQAARKSSAPSSTFKPDVEFELTARVDSVSLKPGAATKVFKYHGKLLKGPASALTEMPGYLGPTLNLIHGQKIRIIAYNDLPEPTVAHWHGMHVPQKMDGHPMYEINRGERYVYEFEVRNRAGTNWYHAHTHEMTATQVYQGLAGLITISDEQEQKLALPSSEYDLPLVIQDRRFTAHNQLQYLQRGRHERILGFLGDTILVNGRINPVIPVKTRAYRLRLLNGSNSRIYKLGWEDGTPLTAIGTDGGLLEKPQTFPYIMLAPAERVELWVDFSGREVGSNLVLQSLEYHGVMPHMGGGMGSRGGMRGGDRDDSRRGGGGMGMREAELAQGSKFPLVKFHIAEKTSESPPLPAVLTPFQRLSDRDVANPGKPIQIGLSMMHMSPELNHRSFEMLAVAEWEKIPVNTIQKIRIYQEEHGMHGGGRRGMGRMEDDADGRGGRRGGRGGMMEMAHPIHLHGQQFQILSRSIRDAHNSGYATVKDGFINHGWKDTVLVMPGEEVTIIKPFQDYTGLFLYHCHNLEHEDMGMMRNFSVE